MQITWFGHSAFGVEFGAARLLIDPFLNGNPSFTGTVDRVSAGVTHVLVTHGHNDHLGDAAAICKATGAQAVCGPEVGDYLSGEGVADVNSGNHGGTVDCGGFTVSFVNALHSSSVNTPDGRIQYLGNPLGLIVKAKGEKTLYHMGDTGIFGDMALINELHQPKVGIVPIGDRYTMGGRDAALACTRFFAFETIVPCHYGTFPILDPNAETFLDAMGKDRDKVTVPEIGKPFAA